MSTLILSRGLTRECGHRGAFPDLLQDRLRDSRIIAIDLPRSGSLNGLSGPVESRCS